MGRAESSGPPSGLDGPGLAVWLLRPFVDLEPCGRGPLYARGLEHSWGAFADDARPRFVLQRTLPEPFRAQFLEESGLREYIVADPRHLPRDRWTRRWDRLCRAIDSWGELTPDLQCRLVLLLHALCFYPLIVELVPDVPPATIAAHEHEAELAYWRASSRYVHGLTGRVADYGAADLSEFETIAAMAPAHAPAAFNAALKLLVHRAKVGTPLAGLAPARARAERILADAVAKSDTFTRELLLSRFYRAVAFLPQASRDRADVVRLMDLAEAHARAMVPVDEAQELIYLENLHPVMESRTKEALWLGDLDLAVARAQCVIDLDPYDSKAWLELGQVRRRRKEYALAAEAYVVAATLGPPASAIARHMAGLCFRELGQPLMAAFFFKAALDVDPLGISPHEEIQDLPETTVLGGLKEWSRQTAVL